MFSFASLLLIEQTFRIFGLSLSSTSYSFTFLSLDFLTSLFFSISFEVFVDFFLSFSSSIITTFEFGDLDFDLDLYFIKAGGYSHSSFFFFSFNLSFFSYDFERILPFSDIRFAFETILSSSVF